MNLNALDYLHLVVATGSFAGAAQAAGVSQPAITQAMQSLEKELGLALFEKVGRTKRATAAARGLAQQVSRLHRQIESLSAPAEGTSQEAGAGPVLRVGVAPAAALLYGPTVEDTWRRHEPEGLLQLVGGTAPELLSALSLGDLDLVIAPRPRRLRAEGLQHQVLHTSLPTVYARVGHPLSAATSLRDIEQAGWAVSGSGGTAGNVIEEAHRVRRLPAPRILVQCADYMTVLDLVSRTDLLCVVPHPALLQKRHEAAVRALHLREGLPKYEVCLFWWPGRQACDSAVIESVVEALTRGAGRHRPAALRTRAS